METSLLNRMQATLLAIATLALFVLAVLNFEQQQQSPQPDDGVWWHEAAGGLQAQKVLATGPGERAGVLTGDLLTAVTTSRLPGSPTLSMRFTAPVPGNRSVIPSRGKAFRSTSRSRSLWFRSIAACQWACGSSASSISSLASMCSFAAGARRDRRISIFSAWSRLRCTHSSSRAGSTGLTGRSSG